LGKEKRRRVRGVVPPLLECPSKEKGKDLERGGEKMAFSAVFWPPSERGRRAWEGRKKEGEKKDGYGRLRSMLFHKGRGEGENAGKGLGEKKGEKGGFLTI